MKKYLLITYMMLCLSLIACKGEDPYKLSVIVPNGTPAIAQAYMEHEQNHIYDIERVSGPQLLVAAFTSQSHDIIIAPINLGANLYVKESPYQLAGVLTWSNLQVISNQVINDLDDLQGKSIYAFGQGATPQMIIDYLFTQAQIDVTIDYTSSSAQGAYLNFLQDDNGIAIISEPLTSTAKANHEDLYILDLGDLWQETTDKPLFPQAGIFVRKDLSADAINQYLNDIEDAAFLAIDKPSTIATYCENLDYPFERDIIEAALANSGIAYQSSVLAENAIDDFIDLIYDFKPQLIGGEKPDENWFYHIS